MRFFLAWGSDPDIQLMHLRDLWQDTDNPYYAWEAINICARHKCAFPDWVQSYLEQCAKRMMDAGKSKASNDLRAILPGVFGFPKKRGPGHPLRPDGDEDGSYMFAAIVFAVAIGDGQKPSQALHKASETLDQPLADNIDDKTLLEHIKKFFGVKKAPRSNADWKGLIDSWYRETFGALEKKFRELSP
jgi:hypothetical protein